MSQQIEKVEDIECNKRKTQVQKGQIQSEEEKRISEIAEQFNQTNIQSDPSEIQSPQMNSENIHNHLKQWSGSAQSNIIKIDKRFLLPEEARYITYLSENTKLLKEKYVEHCMDSIQSIQEFVQNLGQSRKRQQSDFRKITEESNQQRNLHITEFNQQSQLNAQMANVQVVSQKKASINNKTNVQKLKEDPLFQEKFSITQKILEALQVFEIQSSSKKVSILEDALILCLVFQKLSNEKESLIEQYQYILKQYNYDRSFQAFSTRIKLIRNLYNDWTIQNLEQLLKVIREFPKKVLEDHTLIQQNTIKLSIQK